MGPKIEAPTILEQRRMRQRQIIDAAMEMAIENGAESVTVSAVARRAGISRSAFYEYFSSSADLIADLIMEELSYYRRRLGEAVQGAESTDQHIELWIAEALTYVADGRHILVKSLNSVSTPEFRKSEIAQAHRELMSSVIAPLHEYQLSDISVAVEYLQKILDAASIRIDSGKEPALEIQFAQQFAVAGLRALKGNS